MEFIVFFFIVFMVLSISRNSTIVLQVSFLLIAYFFSLRNDLVPDAAQYNDIYYDDPEKWRTRVEFGYLAFVGFLRDIGIPFRVYLFTLVMIQFECWFIASKKLFERFNLCHLFLLCMSFYGMYFWGIVLRASIAISMAYLGFVILFQSDRRTYVKILLFYAIVAVAATIHRTALLYLLAPLFMIRYNKWVEIAAVAFSVIFIYLTNTDVINSYMGIFIDNYDYFIKFNHYLNKATTQRIDFPWIVMLFISTLLIIAKLGKSNLAYDRKFNFFSNLYLTGFVLTTLTLHILAGARLGMMFMFFEFIPVYYLIFRWKKLPPTIPYLIMMSYVAVKSAYLVYSTPKILFYHF